MMADERDAKIFTVERLFARVRKALDNPPRIGLDRMTATGMAAGFETPVLRAAELKSEIGALNAANRTVPGRWTKNNKKPFNLWQYAAVFHGGLRRKRHETFRNH